MAGKRGSNEPTARQADIADQEAEFVKSIRANRKNGEQGVNACGSLLGEAHDPLLGTQSACPDASELADQLANRF